MLKDERVFNKISAGDTDRLKLPSPSYPSNQASIDVLVDSKKKTFRANTLCREVDTCVQSYVDELPQNINDIIICPMKNVSRGSVEEFDPNQLEGAKRSMKSAEIFMAKQAKIAKEENEKREFKALPLPNGVDVQNNLMAFTKSAQSKVVTKRDLASKGTCSNAHQRNKIGTIRFDVSDLLMNREGTKKRTRPKGRKNCNANQFSTTYPAINIPNIEEVLQDLSEDDSLGSVEDVINIDDIGRVSDLRKDVGKLEIKLKKLRQIRLQKEHEDDIISSLASRSILDIMSSSESEYYTDENSVESFGSSEESIKENQQNAQNNYATATTTVAGESMYERQKRWLDEQEQKRERARIEKEKASLVSSNLVFFSIIFIAFNTVWRVLHSMIWIIIRF